MKTRLNEKNTMVYLDYAATTPLKREVLEKMMPYLTENFGNPDSSHAFGRRAMAAVDDARDKIARLLCVKPSEVYFTSGGSESNTFAVLSALRANPKKRRLVLSSVEHSSLISLAEFWQKEGGEVTFLPVNREGAVQLNALEECVKEDTALIAVMAANNEVGTLQPVNEIAAFAKEKGIFFYSDCVQAAGILPLPTFADAFGFSAHKFYGPKGVGCLVAKKGTPLSPVIFGGQQERGKRGGTTFVAGAVGLAEALSLAVNNRESNFQKISSLKTAFEEGVKREIPSAKINGAGEARLPGISNITFPNVSGTSLLFRLDLMGFAVSLGSACSSGSIGASHVLTAMGLSNADALSSVRFSFGADNTLEEVNALLAALKQILLELS